MFIGPVACVPLMLLSVYGIGTGVQSIPPLIRYIMKFSYLRHSLEGIIYSIYGFNRGDMVCPNDEMFCPYKKPEFLLRIMGFDHLDLTTSILGLLFFYIFFNLAAVYLIKLRLSYTRKRFWAVQYVSRVVKQYMSNKL
jgi:hypothetical protein